MKKNFCLWGCIALTMVVLMQSSSLAETRLCNVAAFQPTEGGVAYDWPTARGVDDSLYFCTHGTSSAAEYWRVDLGQEFDVKNIVLNSRTWNPDRTNDATLQAFDSLNQPVGDPIVLSGYTAVADDPNTPEDETNIVDSLTWDNGGAAWQGVQYFQIGGENGDGMPIGVPYLHVMEFQAMANVDCTIYPGFIEGVSVDDGGLGLEHVAISPDFLTDGSTMTDKYGTIGSPDALSYSTIGGFWHSNYDVNETNTPVLTFDLGGSYDLTSMAVWNINQPGSNTARGFKDVIIRTSTDGVTYTEITDTNGTELGTSTFERVPDTTTEGDTVPNQGVFDLSGINASYIQIEALNSHGAETAWGLSEVRFYGTAGTPQIPGDANEDGMVDGSDVTILANNWQRGVGMPEPDAIWAMGDFNGDGMVDGSDVTILANNWQYGVTSAASAVPEPSTILLLLCGLGASLFCFKNRK